MNTGRLQLLLLSFVILISIHTMQAQENNQLTPRQESIAGIAALTATGDQERLKTQFHTGLDAGLTINEIKEILVHLYAYCGFPRSLNGINTFMAVLEDRKAKGYHDPLGREATLPAPTTDKYERGRKVLETLTKTAQPKPTPGYGEFAPRIDAFLKEHLFADVFDSDVLSYQEREIVTISVLSAMTGVEAQLQSHLRVGANTGISNGQLLEIAALAKKLAGKKQGVASGGEMMIRLAEIEIFPEHLSEYKAILREEAAASVKIEPGVLSIFPMYQKNDSTQIRIVEIYANKGAYQHHLTTPHFLKYKTSTLKMVKALKLVDMEAIDRETMAEIFRKLDD